MELTLKRLLEQAKFTTTRKGYDQDEVDDFLDRAVAMATKVEARLTQALADAGKGGTAAPEAAAPAAPTRSEEEIEAEIAAQVEQRVAARVAQIESAAPKAPVVDDTAAAEEAARTLLLAQRTADAAVAEAKQEAEQLRAKANAEVEEQRRSDAAQVEQERAEARGRLAKEIEALEGARDGLRADVSTLESHVEEQRLQLQSAIAELQRLLDDPSAFRLAPAPQVREVDVPSLAPDPGAGSHSPAEPSSSSSDRPTGSGVVGSDPEPPKIVEAAAPADGDEGTSGPAAADDPEASLDVGPPTAPVPVVDLPSTTDPIAVASAGAGHTGAPASPSPTAEAGGGSDDSFLAELRKAMADEEPLGPRDVESSDAQQSFLDDDRRGWRFGKRR